VMYRSCKNGRVSQIVLAAERRPNFDFPIHVKKRQFVQDAAGESWEVAIDVTTSYAARKDRPLDRDWTEVILLGRDGAHNTVNELSPDLKSKNWLMQLTNKRFYRFPHGVCVRSPNITTGQPENRHAYGLESLVQAHSEKMEDVPAEHPVFGPVVIRY